MTAIKSLGPGKYVMVDGVACRVLKTQSSVSGKHGSAKTRMDCVGLIDGKRRSVLKKAGTDMEIPVILKKTAQVLSISENMAQIMDTESYETFDTEIPEEIKGEIEAGKEVNYWDIQGTKVIKGLR